MKRTSVAVGQAHPVWKEEVNFKSVQITSDLQVAADFPTAQPFLALHIPAACMLKNCLSGVVMCANISRKLFCTCHLVLLLTVAPCAVRNAHYTTHSTQRTVQCLST